MEERACPFPTIQLQFLLPSVKTPPDLCVKRAGAARPYKPSFFLTFDTMPTRLLLLLAFLVVAFNACTPDHAQVITRTRDYANEANSSIQFILESEMYVCETKSILEHRFFENNHQLIFDRTDQQEVNDLHSAVTRLSAYDSLSREIKDSLLLCLSDFNRLADRIITQQNPNNETLGEKISNTVADWVGIDINEPFFNDKDLLYQRLNKITLLQDALRVQTKKDLQSNLLKRLNEEAVLVYQKPLTSLHPLFVEARDTLQHLINLRFKNDGHATTIHSNCALQEHFLFP